MTKRRYIWALGAFAMMLAACSDNSSSNEDSQEAPETQALVGDASNSGEVEPPLSEQSEPVTNNNAILSDGRYLLFWPETSAQCVAVLRILNAPSTATAQNVGVDYARQQAQSALNTGRNVQWSAIDDNVESATLEYFNDGSARSVERRIGRLSGHIVMTLWAMASDGNFILLDYGHAGANTNSLPSTDNLHTKLTYSVADIKDIENRYVTLVSPLNDIDPSGDVYVISWAPKEGASEERSPADYYPIVSCVMKLAQPQQ